MSSAQLRPFSRLESLQLVDVKLGLDGPPLPRVRFLGLTRVSTSPDVLRWFPDVQELMVDETSIDERTLTEATSLRGLMLIGVAPPSIDVLARIRHLDTVHAVSMPCATPGCAMAFARALRRLRPGVTVRIDGLEVR